MVSVDYDPHEGLFPNDKCDIIVEVVSTIVGVSGGRGGFLVTVFTDISSRPSLVVKSYNQAIKCV